MLMWIDSAEDTPVEARIVPPQPFWRVVCRSRSSRSWDFENPEQALAMQAWLDEFSRAYGREAALAEADDAAFRLGGWPSWSAQ